VRVNSIHHVKTFFNVFFKFWSRFTFLNVFFIFQTFFILKNVGKVQSGKQINKMHFQKSKKISNEMDL